MSKFLTALKLLTRNPMGLKKAIDRNFSRSFISRCIPDKAYLRYRYKANFCKKLNLTNPQTFNEKLNWLKLNDRKNSYTNMVDKYEVKKLVANKIGEQYLIKTLCVCDDANSIKLENLPNQFVLKCTHDSGSTIICRDKNKFDLNNAKKVLRKKLKRNMYFWGREWPYKNVKPRIIVEEYVKDGNKDHLPVYKFMCFNGSPKIIQTIQNDKQSNETVDYFDVEWNRLDIRQNFPNSEKPLSRPRQLEQMLELAKKLSEGHSFIRVDLYVINETVYFSEYTFYSDCGLVPFYPEEWDYKLGKWIVLPS